MDPSIGRHPVAGISRRTLAFWVLALGVGAYLGYGIAYSLTLTELATLGALFAGFMAVTIFAILVVVAIVAALLPERRGRPAARTTTVAAVLLAVGVGVGWAVTSALV